MFWKNLLCEGPKVYVLQELAIEITEKLYIKKLLCDGQKSYVLQEFAILRTEKLSFARICYVKDQKAMFCKFWLY